MPTLKANTVVKAHFIPSFAPHAVTYEKPTMAPMSKMAARIVLMIPTAISADCSSCQRGEGRRLQGFINDTSTLALLDTGSNVMLISESLAASQAMRVNRSASYCEEPFGSTQQSVICDFYVLDGLPVDIVFSGDFLFELQVFSMYEHCMVQHDLFAEITGDFLKKREEDELRFRDEIRDHLNSVPNEDESLTAKRLESCRRKDWEERQEQLRQWLRVQTPSDSASSEGPSPAATQQKKAKKVSFFRRRRQSGDIISDPNLVVVCSL
ncbi:hypothetical protein LY76DRAFT_642497 [Colletotrichum caudatum]|nr:hypothetical protein LY76DRAFT_642497 [Colletotrichum caudatum]